MEANEVNADAPSVGLFAVVRDQGLRCIGTRSRRWMLAITALLGLLATVAVTASTVPADRAFVRTLEPQQSLMSVTLAFFGGLLASDLWRTHTGARLAPTFLAVLALAIGFALYGVLLAALAVVVAPSGAPLGRWQHVGAIALGSVVVQVVAVLTGTGLGLLMRRHVMACLATIVLPIGLWAVLGSLDAVRPAQAWLTPYSSVPKLLEGTMTPVGWLQELVIALIWAVGLNAVGVLRLGRGRAAAA